jgi:hypothetical protein
MTAPLGDEQLERMLDDGFIAPTATPLGDRREKVTARVYRHPGLEDDDLVVRLIGDTLAPGEDSAMAGLGFRAPERIEDVGVGRPQALRFPHWAYVHAPAHASYAAAVAKRLDALRPSALKKPKKAGRPIDELAREVEALAPVLLCAFLEAAARLLLEVGAATAAVKLFARARKAADAAGLVISADEKYALMLEFAQAGALDAAVVAAYLKELSTTCAADVVYARYRRISLERVVHGQIPPAQAPATLERLAKQAGCASGEEDVAVCLGFLSGAAIAGAPLGFWRGLRPLLVRAAALEPAVKGLLLGITPTMPRTHNEVADTYWLGLLADCGAWESLTERAEAVPVAARPPHGAAEWLGRFARNSVRDFYFVYSSHKPVQVCSAELVDLLHRMAPRLTAEGIPVEICTRYDTHVDLLDRALGLGIPVADPGHTQSVREGLLLTWGRPDQSDLTALAADPRFRPNLARIVTKVLDSPYRNGIGSAWMQVPGLAPLVTGWIRSKAEQMATYGVFEREMNLRLWKRLHELDLSPRLRAADPAAWEVVHGGDYVDHLTRTLRLGIFDEFGWAALDEACEDFEPYGKDEMNRPFYRTVDQWPYLIVHNGRQAVVVAHDKIVHRADLPPLPASYPAQHLLRWTEGSIEVEFVPSGRVGVVNGSVEIPGGARSFGAAPMHAGESEAAWRGPVATDGDTYWTRENTDQATGTAWRPNWTAAWCAFDPLTGELGEEGGPGLFERTFTDERLAERFHDAELAPYACSLKTMPEGSGPSPMGQAGLLVGWRAVVGADGAQAGMGVDGRQAELARPPMRIDAADRPTVVGAIRFPGAENDMPVVFHFARRHTDGYKLTVHDAQGRVHAFLKRGAGRTPQAFATRCIPPWELWHLLTPRDPAGSAALRAVDEATVRALMHACDGASPEQCVEALGRLLPEVTHLLLRWGIISVIANVLHVKNHYRDYGAPAPAKESDHEH